MMNVFRKIKLALFSSGFILASYDAYAMTEEEKEKLPKGLLPVAKLLPLPGCSTEPALPFSPPTFLPGDVLNELFGRLATLNKNAGENSASSLVDTSNDSDGRGAASFSSSPTLEIKSVPKKDLEDISARLSPIYGILNIFEGQIKNSQEKGESAKVRKKRGSTRVEGEEGTSEVSSPTTNVRMEHVSDFEKELSGRFRDIHQRLIAVCSFMNTAKASIFSSETKEGFKELYKSFNDAVNIYRKYYPSYHPTPEDQQRKHIQKGAAFAVIRQSGGNNSSTLEKLLSVSEVSREEKKCSSSPRPSSLSPRGDKERRAFKLSATPPIIPSGKLSSSFSQQEAPPLPSPPARWRSETLKLSPSKFSSESCSLPSSSQQLPTSPPFSPRDNGSFPSSRPLPIPPGLSKNESSASAPLLLPPQQEGPSSSRSLPVFLSEKSPSSSMSLSPSLSLSAPSRPPRSRSISTPVKKMEPAASASPSSPPSNKSKRWAFYSEAPVDLLGQSDQSD